MESHRSASQPPGENPARRFRLLVFWISLLAGSSPEAQQLVLERIADGLDQPVAIFARQGDPRVYVVEQRGRIVGIDPQLHREEIVLDIRDRVRCCGERGLLGAAFDPRSDHLFVNYTRVPDGATVVSKFELGGARADPGSESVVLVVSQPFSNHNGGTIVFGPDGHLWIGLGDGGSGGDPLNHGQNGGTLLGSLLRLDVTVDPYVIPPDNPFVTDPAIRDEIAALGLRNPWKFSFDRENGDLWLADVGQGDVEEVDLMKRGVLGLNFGWAIREGPGCFEADSCDSTGLTDPVFSYEHDEGGCAVTGGHLYRGTEIESLQGEYVFGDFCLGTIWSFDPADPSVVRTLFTTSMRISSFGEDIFGEILVADYFDGSIHRIGVEETPLRRRGVRR